MFSVPTYRHSHIYRARATHACNLSPNTIVTNYAICGKFIVCSCACICLAVVLFIYLVLLLNLPCPHSCVNEPVCLSKMGWPGLSIGRSYSIGWLDPRFLSKILRPREDLLAGLHGHFHVVKGTCDTSALLLCLTRLHQVSHDEYTSSVCT